MNIKQSILAIFLIISIKGIAQQEGFEETNRLSSFTPNASAFQKFVDFPVNYNRGTADISIPLYNIDIKGLKVPITLRYNTSGIRVDEEASWVGLGWLLDIGGVINQEVNYRPDYINYSGTRNFLFNIEQINNYPYQIVARIANPPFNFMPSGLSCDSYGMELDPDFKIMQMTDLEPDVYSYNFNGYSGKFFNDTTGVFVVQDESPIKFSGNIYEMRALTPDGCKYIFDISEVIPNIDGRFMGDPLKISYYLTKIITPYGDTVVFNYITHPEIVYTAPSYSSSYLYCKTLKIGLDPAYYWGLDPYAPSENWSLPSHEEWLLEKISFKNGIIKFNCNPLLRSDVKNARSLKNVEIYSIIGNDTSFLYGYNFYTSYFIGSYLYGGTTNYYPLQYDGSNLNNRLRLDSVVQYNITQSMPPYTFLYNSIQLPYKTSLARDYWGYFNGKNNRYLNPIPAKEFNINVIDTDFWDVRTGYTPSLGGCRLPDSAYVKAGILEYIKYPTGLTSHFTYQSNTYVNPGYERRWNTRDTSFQCTDWNLANDHVRVVFNIGGEVGNIVPLTVSLEFNVCDYDPLEVMDISTNTFGRIKNAAGEVVYEEHVRRDGSTIVNLFSAYLLLTKGQYTAEIFLDDAVGPPPQIGCGLFANMVVHYSNPISKIAEFIGPGLRVKSITTQDMVRTFSYVDQNGICSGKLLTPLRFLGIWNIISKKFTTETTDISTGVSYQNDFYVSLKYYYVNSTGLTKGTNTVGYDNVEVRNTTTNENGFTRYTYYNAPDKYFEEFIDEYPYETGLPPIIDLQNGKLLKQVDFNSSGDTLRLIQNYYINKNDYPGRVLYSTQLKAVYGCKYYPSLSVDLQAALIPCLNSGTYICTASSCGNSQCWFYPLLASKVQLDRTFSTMYYGSNKVIDSVYYKYTKDGFLLSEKKMTNDGSYLLTSYQYPSDNVYPITTTGSDSIGKGIKQLRDINFISAPIEVYTKKDTRTIGGSLSLFQKNGNYIAPFKTKSLEVAFPLTDFTSSTATTSGTFTSDTRYNLQYQIDRVDSKGNILQYHKDNGTIVSFIWGYNNSLIVAKIIGVPYSAISSIVPANLQTMTNAQLSTFLTSLRNNAAVANALVTTYIHKPLVGVLSVTDEKGIESKYNYDGFGRLISITDANGVILKSYQYHYQGQ